MVDFWSRDFPSDSQGTIVPLENDRVGLRLLLDDFFHERGGEDHFGGAVREGHGGDFVAGDEDVMILGGWGKEGERRVRLGANKLVPGHQIGNDYVFFEEVDRSD